MSLPAEDMYELQIVEVQYTPNKPQFKNMTPPKDEVTLICELIGTQNAEFEDKPYKVWVFGLRDGQMPLGYPKNGKPETGNAGKVLLALGVDWDTISKIKFKEIDWQALNGLFLRGAVSHKPDGKNLSLTAEKLFPVKNPEHQKRNEERHPDILPKVAA